jgi:hypothetical protein
MKSGNICIYIKIKGFNSYKKKIQSEGFFAEGAYYEQF